VWQLFVSLDINKKIKSIVGDGNKNI